MGKSRPPIERLMEKVARLDAGCWQWTHYVESKGYARLWVDGKNVYAHRWSYEFHFGPISDELQIDHLCRNRACVNPEHLEPVTPAENVRRSELAEARRRSAAQITHCPAGHLYDAANTLIKGGARVCRTCKKQKAREYYERNRDLVAQRAATWRQDNPERSREVSREATRRLRAKKKAA